MRQCIFFLSELEEIGSLLEEKNKERFVSKFSECIRQLLCLRSFMDPLGGAADPFETPPLLSSYPDLNIDWVLLKETVVFEPDYRMRRFFITRISFLKRCRERMKQLRAKGIGYWISHYRRYRLYKRYYNAENKVFYFQDIFSAAVAHFELEGWGNGSDFKRLLD